MRVQVIGSHALIAHSLVSMLRSLAAGDDSIQASLGEVESAVDPLVSEEPDVALVEASIDFAAGLDMVRLLRSARNDLRILVLGTASDDGAVLEAFRAGAHGYLAQTSSTSTLVATLRGVARGELGLSRRTALRIVDLMRQASAATPRPFPMTVRGNLTKREAEVLDLVRRGLRSREIAVRLCIAETTVNKHIQNVLSKLHVHSRTQAVVAVEASLGSRPGSSHLRRNATELRRITGHAMSTRDGAVAHMAGH